MAYPENTLRAVFQFQMPNGSQGFVTPHFRKSDGGDYTLAEMVGLGDVLEDWYVNANFEGSTNQPLRQNIVDQCTLTSITLTRLGLLPIQVVNPVLSAGAQTGSSLPNETSLVVTLYTAIAGRRYRGRNFWPGLSVIAMEDNGTFSNAIVAELQTTFTALRVGVESATGSELAVNSSLGTGTIGAPVPLSTFVTSVVVRDTPHHQRRRNS